MTKNDKPLAILEKRIAKQFNLRRDSVAKRFPITFGLAATFGISCVFYGIHQLIEKVPFLTNNPWVVIISGLLVLIITGQVYKKLS